MKTLKHPNIIKTRDVYTTQTNQLCIVMEYASKGDLDELIEERLKKLDLWDEEQAHFSEQEIMDIFVQICMALETLHANKIIHRDLKTHNLLMTENS